MTTPTGTEPAPTKSATGTDSAVTGDVTTSTKTAGQPEAQKLAELAAAAAKLEVKVPEGLTIAKAQLDAFRTTAAELGLDSAKAQKLVDYYGGLSKASEAAATEAWEKQRAVWQAAVKADKELGGADFEKNLAFAQRALKTYGGEGLTKALAETGMGDHPELVRAFVRIGKAMAEDTNAGGESAGAKVDPAKKLARSIYTKSPQLFAKE